MNIPSQVGDPLYELVPLHVGPFGCDRRLLRAFARAYVNSPPAAVNPPPAAVDPPPAARKRRRRESGDGDGGGVDWVVGFEGIRGG